jgi:branched-chain amino acid transport system permease protein
MRGRPLLRTAYGQDLALFDTGAKRLAVGALVLVGLVLPWIVQDELLLLLALGCVTAIGAIGLNIVTGYAGQVSLGHAFFLGIGAYTAAVISGDPEGRTLGYGITELLVWLPAAGIAAGLAGVIVAPLATRLRGLYLAIVTLGLVFIGGYIFNDWSNITGGEGVGRPAPTPVIFGFDLKQSGDFLTGAQKVFLLMFVLLLLFALAARNLARSRVGRAFTAIRDRDIAAGIIGVSLAKYKTIAFGISSFYAGCAGALLYVGAGYFDPTSFNLLLSVEFIAMVLIGGAGTISGSILGAFFITLLPRFTRAIPDYVPWISNNPSETPNSLQLQTILYGLLIILFLIFEPRGLFGIWLRIRNYWKAFPFSY